MKIERNPTRSVRIGTITIGAGHPIAVQSMTATKTQDVEATSAQAQAIADRGAGVVRIAVDSDKDAAALAEIRQRTGANLAVDLQENFRLAEKVAPHVDKIRYNPGHLYHHLKQTPWQDKVRFIVDQAVAGVAACYFLNTPDLAALPAVIELAAAAAFLTASRSASSFFW